jgi:phage protein D
MPDLTYSSELTLEINGKPAPLGLLEDILQVSVEESLHLPSMFMLVIRNSAASGRQDDPMWQHDSLFEIGKKVQIGMTNSPTQNVDFQEKKTDWLIWGEITAIETHFTTGSQAPIIIRGYDRSHRLHRGCHNRSFQKMTDTEILKKIIGEVGLVAGTTDDSNVRHDYVFQENQTNMEFLRERAIRNGFELFMQNDKLHFRKPKQNSALDLEWQKELTSFQVRVTSAEQVSAVEVRGWDYKKQAPIVATQRKATPLTRTEYGLGTATSSAFQGKPWEPTCIIVDQPVNNQNEAQAIADSLFNELCDEFVHADAQTTGNPLLHPGCVVTLKGMGKYSGKYYITEAHHSLSEGSYMTSFSVRGLRGGDLLSLLAPSTRLQPGQTLLIGKVTNNEDPEGLGRVRVMFPTLTEKHDSQWARVVAAGAGQDRGFDCLPEINDEVLVGFEHGDIHRPFVMGGLWNGTQKPPETVSSSVTGTKVRVRTFKTRTGHHLQFTDEDQGSSKKGIQIKSVYGHQVHLNDSERFIEVKTNNGHTLRMDDGSGSIEMTSTGDIKLASGRTGTTRKISLNAGEIALTATQKITLTIGGNTVEVTPTGVRIQAAGTVDIQGTTTAVKGSAVVQVQGAIVKIN